MPYFRKLTLFSTGGLTALGLMLALAGCEAGQNPGNEPKRNASPSAALASAKALSPSVSSKAPTDRAQTLDPDAPSHGEADQNDVTLKARYTPRAQLLRQLGERYAFNVIGRAAADTSIDVDVEGVPLEAALAAVLEGEAYALQYAARSAADRKIETVLLGDMDGHMSTLRNQRMAKRRAERNKKTAQARKQKSSARHETLAALEPDEREAYLERERIEREERKRAESEQARAKLYSSDPEERVDDLERIGADAITMQELAEIALRDPDPSVRAAAVSNASKTESPAAKEIVRTALDDPDPAVVRDAIDELMFEDSPSSIPLLKNLLNHENAEVATAAGEAIEFIQD